MSECEQATRLIAYHDGEMSPDGRMAVERHLRQCPACAAELRRLAAMSELLASIPQPDISPRARRQLHWAVDRMASSGIRRMAETLAAVAATILIVCAIGLARQNSAQATTGLMQDVETAQLSAEPVQGGSEELLARWIVQDLPLGDPHD